MPRKRAGYNRRGDASCSTTPPSNDPLFLEALTPAPTSASFQCIYPGFNALDLIAEMTYNHLCARDWQILKQIPASAFNYYVACLAYARLIQLNKFHGTTTFDEDWFLGNIYNGSFNPPAMIAHYLAGFGNVELDGIKLDVRFKQRDYVTVPGHSKGWFGAFGPQTHTLYRSYPCLAVYAQRMVQDLLFTATPRDPYWCFPDLIASADFGKPNRNILGYAPARKLSREQSDFLNEVGIQADGFQTKNDSIPMLMELLHAVQTQLRYSRDANLATLPDSRSGSLAQCVVTSYYAPEVGQRLDRSISYEHTAYTPVKINGALISVATAYNYHVVNPIPRRNQLEGWAPFDFNGQQDLPQSWIPEANSLHTASCDLLHIRSFTSVSSFPTAQLRSVLEAIYTRD